MKTVLLGDLCTFASGGTPDRNNLDFYLGDIPWITGADIGKSGKITARSFITGNAIARSAARVVPAGTILLVTRTSVGKVTVTEEELSYSQDLTAIFPNSAQVDRDYLVSYLQSCGNYFARHARGATIKGVTRDVLLKLNVPLPALDEQRRIASILGRVNAVRAKRDHAIVKLESLEPAIFHRMFADETTGTVELGSLVSSAQLGLVRASSQFGKEGNSPYIRMDAISADGQFLPHKVLRTEVSSGEMTKFEVVDGDFLMNTRNSRELVGKSAVVHGLVKGTFNNNLLRLRFVDGVSAEFIAAFMSTTEGQRQLEMRKAGTTSVFAMYQRDYLTIEVPCASSKSQMEFTNRIHAVKRLKDKYRLQLSELDTLFSALQEQAFRGDL